MFEDGGPKASGNNGDSAVNMKVSLLWTGLLSPKLRSRGPRSPGTSCARHGLGLAIRFLLSSLGVQPDFSVIISHRTPPFPSYALLAVVGMPL